MRIKWTLAPRASMGYCPDAVRQLRGFTIVELLIVIVIIGIISTITVVTYSNMQNRTNDAVMQSDLTNIAKKIHYFHDINGRWPRGYADMLAADVHPTKAAYSRGMYNGLSWYNLVYCWANSASPDKFALVAEAKSGNVFQYVDGSASRASYTFATDSATNCIHAGVDISASGRDWFYDTDAWQAFAK